LSANGLITPVDRVKSDEMSDYSLETGDYLWWLALPNNWHSTRTFGQEEVFLGVGERPHIIAEKEAKAKNARPRRQMG
jgi:hypothetical protein